MGGGGGGGGCVRIRDICKNAINREFVTYSL